MRAAFAPLTLSVKSAHHPYDQPRSLRVERTIPSFAPDTGGVLFPADGSGPFSECIMREADAALTSWSDVRLSHQKGLQSASTVRSSTHCFYPILEKKEESRAVSRSERKNGGLTLRLMRVSCSTLMHSATSEWIKASHLSVKGRFSAPSGYFLPSPVRPLPPHQAMPCRLLAATKWGLPHQTPQHHLKHPHNTTHHSHTHPTTHHIQTHAQPCTTQPALCIPINARGPCNTRVGTHDQQDRPNSGSTLGVGKGVVPALHVEGACTQMECA